MSAKLPTHPLFKNLTGKRFGKLLVQKYVGRRGNFTMWEVACDCGVVKELSANALQQGTLSCGCFRLERVHEAKATHQMCDTHEYACWSRIKDRCERRANPSYKHYGGRGISVCERWRNSFELFLKDMGKRPDGTEIDRIDNDGDYEPGNCRWVSRLVNSRNKRSNRRLTYRDRTKCISEWAEELGIPPDIISTRLKRGWTVDDALNRPLRYRKRA